jgi:hypothetical protein
MKAIASDQSRFPFASGITPIKDLAIDRDHLRKSASSAVHLLSGCSPKYLHRLRNEVRWPELLKKLKWLQKNREGRLVFQCPLCQEMIVASSLCLSVGFFYAIFVSCLHRRLK